MFPSHSAIKKYKRQLVDQIKGLETDLEKTASTVREMEVGIWQSDDRESVSLSLDHTGLNSLAMIANGQLVAFC